MSLSFAYDKGTNTISAKGSVEKDEDPLRELAREVQRLVREGSLSGPACGHFKVAVPQVPAERLAPFYQNLRSCVDEYWRGIRDKCASIYIVNGNPVVMDNYERAAFEREDELAKARREKPKGKGKSGAVPKGGTKAQLE